MERLTDSKIVLVTRRTRLDDLIARFNTLNQARFYVEHLGADFSDYLLEHRHYHEAVDRAAHVLQSLGRLQVLKREFLPNFVFGEDETIVVLGQDGLVANTLKYIDRQPVVGVNPDPKRWEGILLPFVVSDLPKVIPEVLKARRTIREVTMAKVELDNGQRLYAVNDLFVGPRSHTSARYIIEIGGKSEQHSSSGLIVSTGLGSTGWFRSLMAGACAVAAQLTEGRIKIPTQTSFPWDADYLYYTVREPFPSKTSTTSIVFGQITPTNPLRLVSQMPDYGVIFSDGIENDFLEFNAGTHAVISIAEKRGYLAT